MSWLRTDDGFPQHPKFEAWKKADRWDFLELMHYCAKYRTGGRVPADLTLLPRGVTTRLLTLAEASGWLDRDENGALWVHDWDYYNPKDPTAAERMKRHRDRNANRNGDVTATRNADRNETVTRALARADSRPVPSPTELKAEQVELRGPAALPSENDLNPLDPDDELPDGSDPVIRLLLTLRDRDRDTERVLRAFTGKVSEAAFDFTRDEIERTGGGAGKAVTILKRIAKEGTLASPDHEPASEPGEVTTNASGHGPAYVAGLIRNRVITERRELESEFELAAVPDEERPGLLALLERSQVVEVVE